MDGDFNALCVLAIESPKGAVEAAPFIQGTGTPYACLYIQIDAFPILCACVGETGTWRVENPYPMEAAAEHSVEVSLYAYPCCQICAKETFWVTGIE